MVVVASDRPAAYCVVGRPNAIVVTSAAMKALSPSQLEAVLAHERADIAGRHHHILMVLDALADAMPGCRLSEHLGFVSPKCWRCAPTTPPCVASACAGQVLCHH